MQNTYTKICIKVINSGYNHISVPSQKLYSRAAPSVGGSITAQSVQPQGEMPEEGRKNSLVYLYEIDLAIKSVYLILTFNKTSTFSI